MGLTDFYKKLSSAEETNDNSETVSYNSSNDKEAAVVQLDQNKKEIGYLSATSLCLNRMLGAGVCLQDLQFSRCQGRLVLH